MKLLYFLLFLHAPMISYGQDGVIIDSLKKKLAACSSEEDKIDIWNELSWEYAPVDFKTAKYYADKSLHSKVQLSQKQLATTYNYLGITYDYHSDYETARNYYEKAASIRLKIKDSTGYINCVNNIGATYYTEGILDKALEYYIKAAHARKSIKDLSGLSQSYNNLGLVYRTMHRFNDALAYYKKSVHIKEKLHDKRGLLNTYTNIGVIYLNNGSCDSSFHYFKKTEQLAIELDDENEQSSSLSNLGYAYLCKNDLKSAQNSFLNSLDISTRLEEWNITAYSYKGLGEIALKNKRFEDAEVAFSKALESALKTRRKELLSEISLLQSETFDRLNNPNQALHSYKAYISYRDSVFSEENSKEIHELEAKYEAVNKAKRIQELSYKSDLQKKEAERNKTQRNWLILFIVLIVLILGLTTVSLIQKKKNNTILDTKNKLIATSLNEKEILLKEIHHRVKNNLQIINGLLELQESLHNDVSIKGLVTEAQGRIKTMSIIHEMLYQSEDLSNIQLSAYIERLAAAIGAGMRKNVPINLHFDIDDSSFNIDTIIPLGLIVNELVTNSYKYAFDASQNDLWLTLTKSSEYWVLEIKDSGKVDLGTPFQTEKQSFGLKLVKMLTRQLRGTIDYKFENGSIFTLSFKEI